MKHAESVLAHITATRSEAIAQGQLFDPDALALTIVRSLDTQYGPQPLLHAAKQDSAAKELLPLANSAQEAWMSVRMAIMDDQHGAAAAAEKYEPMYAVQWYETALQNFAAAARRSL